MNCLLRVFLAPRATSELLLRSCFCWHDFRNQASKNSLARASYRAVLLPGTCPERPQDAPGGKKKEFSSIQNFSPPAPSKFYTVHLVQRQPRIKPRFAEIPQETRAPREPLEEREGIVGRALPGADAVVADTRPKNDGAVKPHRVAR